MPIQKTHPAHVPAEQDKVVEKGRRQYLIVPRRGSQAARAGIQPLSADVMKGAVANLPDVEVVRILKPKKTVSAFSARSDEANDAYVVKMDRNRAELLKQTAPSHLIIEQDRFLDYGGTVSPTASEVPARALRGMQGIQSVDVRFRVVGDGDAPLPNTKITLQGDVFPQEGMTDDKGEVTLKLHTVSRDRPARSLFVDPHKDYWDRFILTPDLSFQDVNVIRMKSLKEWFSGFPATLKFGWGQRMMGLDRLPPTLTGKGVKIAIIDSGADNSHSLLSHIGAGMDLTNNRDAKSWAQDIVGHGSHCAGIITGRGNQSIGFRGFAPEAEVFIFKIFPGGQFSSLLEALDECMALDIDIVNMSLGSDQISQAVEQKLEECVLDGVACIVAAGNSGGPVQYPASSPNVLAVSAIGKEKEFPSESWDARTIVSSFVAPDGIFSPSFTCFGSSVGVCAPGVSIISCVPDNGFEPQSGTSMAAPHVAGFAALLLAHHPVFRGPLRSRGPQRVAALFNLIKSACAPYPLGQGRTGAGVPRLDALAQVLTAAAESTKPETAAAAGQPETPAQPTTAAVPSPQPIPAMAVPPGIDPQLWQTIILPQLLGLLVQQRGLPFILAMLGQPGTPAQPTTAAVPSPQPIPAMAVPPGIDPQLWQTTILPQLLGLLAQQRGLPFALGMLGL
jgi:subtilisin